MSAEQITFDGGTAIYRGGEGTIGAVIDQKVQKRRNEGRVVVPLSGGKQVRIGNPLGLLKRIFS